MADLSPEGKIALGVIVGLISTCVQSIGLTLQRKSHMLEDSKEDHIPRRAPYRRRRWQIGMLMFLIANIIGSTIQITTLPLPLLSTLQASGLVFNSILASLLLKEAWTWRTGIGTFLVVAGAFLISWFSAIAEPNHDLNQLVALLAKDAFLVWFSLSLLFTLAVLGLTFFLQHCIAVQRRHSARTGLIRGMSYGMVSGILSAHALLLAKSAVELVVVSVVDKKNEFSNYRSWLLLLAFLFLALTQLYYLHRGLKLVSTSILYPFVFCVYNIVAIMDGMIYFRQTDRLPPLHAGLIALGTVVLLAGVLALSWLQEAQEGDEEDEHHMSKTEIPQTLLVPGLGFVGDPEDDATNESTAASSDDEITAFPDHEEAVDESTALLGRHRRASSRRKSNISDFQGRRRKRAHTLKELREIWTQLSDSDEGRPHVTTRRSASAALISTPGLQEQVRKPRRKSVGNQPDPGETTRLGTIDSVVASRESESPESPQEALQRAATMPNPKDYQGRRRRRSSVKQRPPSGGALFSDMLRKQWWQGKDESDGDEDATGMRSSGHLESPHPAGPRPDSRDSRAKVRFASEGERNDRIDDRTENG